MAMARVVSAEARRARDPLAVPVVPVPDGSRVPAAGRKATRADYDSYFRLARNSPDLAQWSHACLSVLRAQRQGVRGSKLSMADQLRIVEGASTALEILLEKWLDAADGVTEGAE